MQSGVTHLPNRQHQKNCNMLTIEKRHTRQYCITDAHEFMDFKTFVNARKGLRNTPKTCFVCNHKFFDSEQIYLAAVLGDRNRIVCEHCAKRINGQ